MVLKMRRWGAALGLFALCGCAIAAGLPGPEQHVDFKINAPTMVGALIQFTQQTGLQLVYPTDGANQMAAPKVEGSFTPRAALEQLLQDSGLTFEFVNAHTVLVKTRAVRPRTTQDAHATPAVAR